MPLQQDATPKMILEPSIRLVETRHGAFFVLETDTFISRSLIEYGEWTKGEVEILRRLVRPDDNVLDIGANIGCHTIPLAKAIRQNGLVLAFEPQPKLFQLLASNVTVNGLANARLHNAACGDADGT